MQFSSCPPINDDPLAWRVAVGPWRGSRMDAQYAPEAVHDPRPEYDRPQHNPTNPILGLFREYVVDPEDGGLGWCASLWLRCFDGLLDESWAVFQMLRDREPEGTTPEHYAHARRVLTRLTKESA